MFVWVGTIYFLDPFPIRFCHQNGSVLALGFGQSGYIIHHTSHITYHHEHPEHQQHQEHQPLSDQAGERGEDGTAVYAGEVRLWHGGSVCP